LLKNPVKNVDVAAQHFLTQRFARSSDDFIDFGRCQKICSLRSQVFEYPSIAT
jgi:hypothetical protein